MESYEILNLIGKGNILLKKGNFGSISKIKRKSDGKVLVWKELDYGNMNEKEKQHIVAEVNILRDLKHPNIVRYYDRIIDKKNTRIYIIMEYCEGGDMGALIKRCKKNKDMIAEDVIWKIFTQLVLALHECHNRKEGKILHRDLKPSNVFLDSENNIKLGDFGLSKMLNIESTFAYSHVGTPYYMSPEQIDENRYNEKSDIWSLGCFLYELTTFNPPFEATNHLTLALKIKSGKVDRIGSRYSEELQRVISWLLNVDPNSRPSIEDLLNLPQVSLRLRERRLKENMSKLKKFEENLKTKEIELERREKEIEIKLKMLNDEKERLNIFEKTLNEKEKHLNLIYNQNIRKSTTITEASPRYSYKESIEFNNINSDNDAYLMLSDRLPHSINIYKEEQKDEMIFQKTRESGGGKISNGSQKQMGSREQSAENRNLSSKNFRFDPSIYKDNQTKSLKFIDTNINNKEKEKETENYFNYNTLKTSKNIRPSTYKSINFNSSTSTQNKLNTKASTDSIPPVSNTPQSKTNQKLIGNSRLISAKFSNLLSQERSNSPNTYNIANAKRSIGMYKHQIK